MTVYAPYRHIYLCYSTALPLRECYISSNIYLQVPTVLTRSLGVPSSYRTVFFGDKGNESDSSIEDVDNAIIEYVVNRSSSDTPVIVDNVKMMSKLGKSRLVAFMHERTTAASGQGPRQDVSQKAVLQGGEDSDPAAEMRIGLKYVRQLGDPDTGGETSQYLLEPMPTMNGRLRPIPW
jgi:hypothetical protein